MIHPHTHTQMNMFVFGSSRRLPGGEGRLHLMRVPAVGPEEQQPVKQWHDISHVGFPFRKDPENASMNLMNDKYSHQPLAVVLLCRQRSESRINHSSKQHCLLSTCFFCLCVKNGQSHWINNMFHVKRLCKLS